MKKEILSVITHYGVPHQQKKFAEEVFELQEAIMTYEKCHMYAYHLITDEYEQELKEHIAEEMADVLFLIEQFRSNYDISLDFIEAIMTGKINRQINRIREEEENEKN